MVDFYFFPFIAHITKWVLLGIVISSCTDGSFFPKKKKKGKKP